MDTHAFKKYLFLSGGTKLKDPSTCSNCFHMFTKIANHTCTGNETNIHESIKKIQLSCTESDDEKGVCALGSIFHPALDLFFLRCRCFNFFYKGSISGFFQNIST
jgi:hypothetical protein